MRTLLTILALILLQSCTILSKDKYYSVDGVKLLSRDDFSQTDCYEQFELIICSKNLHTKSLLFGVIVPFIPTFGRLDYDLKRAVEVSIHNDNTFSITVSCEKQESNCSIDSQEIKSTETATIPFNNIIRTKLIIRSNGQIIGTIILIPKTRYNTHAVTV